MRSPTLRALAPLVAALSLLAGCGDEECADGAFGLCDFAAAEPTFPGLSASLDIRRDQLGVVHVLGATDADVVYGSGYMQATDRLFQMDLIRRRALGRRAEVLGEGALGDDRFVRLIGIPAMGEENAELMRSEDPATYALLVAWVAGVNARVDEVLAGETPLPYGFGPDELDYAPERWTPSDALAVGKLILFGNANLIEYELLATILEQYVPIAQVLPVAMPLEPTFILPEDERPAAGPAPLLRPARATRPLPGDAGERLSTFFRKMRAVRPGASNNWAMDGRFTANGKPLIAGDPHQGLESPSLMWAQHMNSVDAGGTIDVVGFAFVGTPSVQLGHNRHLAWTATTNYPDTMDLWEVPSDGTTVVVGGEPIPITRKNEAIPVRDAGADAQVVEVVPGYGVLLPEDLSPVPVTQPGHRILLGWAGFGPTHEAVAFQGFDTAASLADFEAQVDRMELGCFNFVGATAEGITYRSSPRVPERKDPLGLRAFQLLDGSNPDAFWTGSYYGPERLPHSRAEQRGWLASANNDPFGFTTDGAVEGDAFYFGVFFDPGTRAARIESELARLAERGDVTLDDMKALQTDTYTRLADALLPHLEAALEAQSVDPALAAYAGRTDLTTLGTALLAWDRRMVRASPDALVFEAFSQFLTRQVVGDDLGIAFGPIADSQPIYVAKLAALTLDGRYPGSETLLQEGANPLVFAALDETALFLTERFGGTDPSLYTWGDFHGTYFHGLWGELDGGFHPTDGGDGTVNVSSASFFADGVPRERMESTGGAIYRMVMSIGDDGTPVAEVIFPMGNSGNRASPFFDNNLADWVEGRYHALPFRTEDVIAATVERRVLAP